ncbi:probable methyltransferase TARBP1 [Gadus chalcogrammus]|uniref:probable methyltransferase TARBP1 n=1 Tax=Gadus chalcogrammus TaxID=1042646 RepID=UPI0024C49F84|nr:probable methyltransferase TARBP1 [Gadus chalcogrammus]
MSSVLINALLTSAPNYDILFDSLSWPKESWPEKERVEALTAFIEGIGQHLAGTSDHKVVFESAKKQQIVTKIESIIWDQCVPFLLKISKENVTDKNVAFQDSRPRQSTAAACRLLGVCIPHCGDEVVGRLADTVLPALQEDDAEGKLLNVEVAIEVIAVLLPSIILDKQLTQTTLSSALHCIRTFSEAVVSKVTVRLLLTLLNSCKPGERLSSVLQFTLDELFTWHRSDDTAAVTERTLLCLTVLSDHLLPPTDLQAQCQDLSISTSRPDARLERQFWMIVQAGLTHKDMVCRKRSLYLLKRCVAFSEEQGAECPTCPSKEDELLFRWSPKDSQLLREFWEDYALVMETLEENQIHVVRPVLNRIDVLIQTTATDTQASGGACCHPSWLLCVYQRMFDSENKSLMREGVYHLLDLQALRQPAFASAFSQFIVGPFMDVLSESSLFHRAMGQSIGDCPELGVKLTAFLTSFFSSLPSEERGALLLPLIQRLGSRHWCAVPVLFLSQALSCLPRSPLLGGQGLQAIREVLRVTMVTHPVLLRGASQCYLLNSALCLMQVDAVTLDEVFSFLTHFHADESLCRGTPLWKQVAAWLSDNEGNFKPSVEHSALPNKGSIKAHVQSEIHSFLQVPASTGHSERLPDPKEADKLARAVLLCVDMEEERGGGGVLVEELLGPLVDTLGRLSTNAYLPLRKTDKCLQLVLRLFQLGEAPGLPDDRKLPEDTPLLTMKKLVLKVVDSVQEFILRRLCSELQELSDVGRAELYLCVLRQLVRLYGASPQYSSDMQRTYFPKLVQVSLDVLTNTTQQVPSVASQVAQAVAMASLAAACDLLERQAADRRPETTSVLVSLQSYFYCPASSDSQGTLHLGNINQTLLKPTSGQSDAGAQAPVLQDWGRTAAHFVRDQWVCLGFLSRQAGPGQTTALSDQTLRAALKRSVDALTLLPSGLVLPVLAFMSTALAQVALCDENLCVHAVTLGWELVQGLTRNPQEFWPALRGFVGAVFHRSILELEEDQAPELISVLKQISAEMMVLSQAKTGVINVLIEQCCHCWLPAGRHGDEAAIASALRYVHVLTEACVYGPVYRRDVRLILEVQTYVEQLGEECTVNLVVNGDNRDDQTPRVCVLALLSHLDPSRPQHRRLLEELVTRLLQKDKDISKTKTRYYSNSLQHRVKNRVWQTLLLLLPNLQEGFVASLLGDVFAAGFCSNQASVKYLIEWTMIVILQRYPEHMESFWGCFSMDHEKTKTSICTFLSVVVHLDLIVPKLEDKGPQWRRALDVILQWCFSHNFSVRLYALLALKRVWGLAAARAEAERAGDGLGGLAAVVEACLSQAEAMQSTGNANKNWTRIQEHFFFGAFHPTRDYSVETILYTFPSLSELSDDEWIPVWKCEKMAVFFPSPALPLRNPSPDLRLLQPGDWIQQDKGEQDKEERWAEVQKKITPWRLGIQEQEPELQLAPQQRAARLGKAHGALVVVASLIDKPTNLGGLCRTCEIFGASALVLDSLRHVEDKHFQSLSVSSELWLPLLEVKPVELTDFLQLKKSEGYCIVGVEQTANSQSLQDYQFPEKTLLLLGNEREGIPANLLQLLDVCVEIPQQGVIRSLNVHVSAALLVWEYTRQHLQPR